MIPIVAEIEGIIMVFLAPPKKTKNQFFFWESGRVCTESRIYGLSLLSGSSRTSSRSEDSLRPHHVEALREKFGPAWVDLVIDKKRGL